MRRKISWDIGAFYEYADRTIRYPAAARRYNVQGTVFAEIELSDSGNIVEVTILEDIGCDCGMGGTGPRWFACRNWIIAHRNDQLAKKVQGRLVSVTAFS